jgi:hypothetical protein
MGQFRSTIRAERIDEIIMEGKSPTIDPNDFRMMKIGRAPV